MNQNDIRFIVEKALARAAALVGFDLRPVVSSKCRQIDVFDLVVRDLLTEKPVPFFLQIGAHDGLSYDPIAPFVRAHRWPGLLVEPQPEIFAALVRNYAGHDNLLFENSAIAEQNGTLTLHRFKSANAEDHASMLTSTRKHYLQLNGDGHQGELEEIVVPALTLDALLDKHHIAHVDILQIDTEGYDFQILQMVDFTRIKPVLIHFESNFLNSRQKAECLHRLNEQGYAVSLLGIDTIAYLKAPDKDAAARLRMSKIVTT